MMKEFWNERYAAATYGYGTQPNDFLAYAATRLPPQAKILSLGEGEGRNAVFLAGRGHHVTALDQSEVGLKKAQQLAATQGCRIDTQVADLVDFDLGSARWDAIISIFCHVPQELRHALYPRIAAALKPNGLFIMEAYAPEQLGYGSGGPKEADWLVALADVAAGLPTLTACHAMTGTRTIQEGQFHNGLSCVTQYIGAKI